MRFTERAYRCRVPYGWHSGAFFVNSFRPARCDAAARCIHTAFRLAGGYAGELVYYLHRQARLYEKLGVWKKPRIAEEVANEALLRYETIAQLIWG
jgi:hypothetical protein